MNLFRKYAREAFGEDDLEELRGKVLLCHCKKDQDCHADVLLEMLGSTQGSGGESLEDGLPVRVPEIGQATQDREYDQELPEGTWKGWLGEGPPREAPFMGKRRPFADGGGLCSPGRWPPNKRLLPKVGQGALLDKVAGLFRQDLKNKTTGGGDIFGFMLRLAAGRFDACPFGARLLDEVRAATCGAFGVPDGEKGIAEGQAMHLGILSHVLRVMGDPDADFVKSLEGGYR